MENFAASQSVGQTEPSQPAEQAPDRSRKTTRRSNSESLPYQFRLNLVFLIRDASLSMECSGGPDSLIPGSSYGVSNTVRGLCSIPGLCHLATVKQVDKNVLGPPHGALVATLGIHDPVFCALRLYYYYGRKLHVLEKV